MQAGYQIHNGDLVLSLGNIPNGILDVHAYIPMGYTPVGLPKPLEDDVVAYRNQMRAKRVCDKYRKRYARQGKTLRTTIMGVTVK